jgi:hypothetical protein
MRAGAGGGTQEAGAIRRGASAQELTAEGGGGGVLVGDEVRRDVGTCALRGGSSCAGHTAGRRTKSDVQGARVT